MPRQQKVIRLIGIDYGSSNIGLSLGVNGFVTPLEIIPGKNVETAIYKIIRIALENKVDKFVIGLPLTAEEKETKQSLDTRMFAKKLKVFSKKPVEFQNEFGTSKEALNRAIDLDTPQRKRVTNDHLSASLILRRYYEER
ncbi:Holliday junction resolvase RuvX [Patescibacteria group bacterium]